MSAPKPPDAGATSNQQLSYNQEAAKLQNAGNLFNQSTPYGSQNWAADPNSPSGYSGQTNLSPAQQQLLNLQQGGQTALGGAGQSLAQNISGMYSSAPDLSAQTGQTASMLNKWNQQYLQPIFGQQQSNLDSSLANKGLAPGGQAYDNAQNLLARNQGDVTNQYLSMNEPTAFNQSMQQYQLPLSIEQQLMGGSAPQGPNFQQTPSAQIQPPNYQQQVQQQYAAQQAQYGNMMSGLFAIPTALAGGWARGGFGGLNVGTGMFGGGSLTGF